MQLPIQGVIHKFERPGDATPSQLFEYTPMSWAYTQKRNWICQG
jgi:hypothetical protein